MTSNIKSLLLLTTALVIAQNGFGAVVTWNLNNITFNDGATATGSFNWDADSSTASNWNISVSAGTLSAFSYTTSDSQFWLLNMGNPLMAFDFQMNGSTRELRLTPISALTDAGGTVAINLNTAGGGSGSVECYNCAPYRPVVSGSFVSAAPTPSVPEPGSVGLIGLGLCGSFFVTRNLRSRRK